MVAGVLGDGRGNELNELVARLRALTRPTATRLAKACFARRAPSLSCNRASESVD
jgi:hypothetical protein